MPWRLYFLFFLWVISRLRNASFQSRHLLEVFRNCLLCVTADEREVDKL